MSRRELRLFQRDYNRDALDHVIFTSHDEYVNRLMTYWLATYPYNTYKINRGQVLLSFDGENAPLSLRQLKGALYVADVELEEPSGQVLEAWYYHVDAITEQSGYVILDVTRDLWADFMPNATFSEFHVKRCNRVIGIGKYDEITLGRGNTEALRLLPRYESISNYTAVFLLNYNIAQRIFGGGSVSKTQLFAISLTRIYDAVHNHNPSVDALSIIEKAIGVVGGIKSIAGRIGTAGAQLDANAVKMWIVPSETIEIGNTGVSQIVCASPFPPDNNTTEIVFNNVYSVMPKHYVKTLDLSTFNVLPESFGNLMPAYDVAVGTFHNALQLPRLCGVTSSVFYYHFVYTATDVHIYVQQGKATQDITAGFEAAITFDDATESSLVSTAKSMGKLAVVAGAALKGYAKGGVAGAVIGGGSAAALTMAASISEHEPSTQGMNSGDAAVTYGDGVTEVLTPYCVMITPSTGDEMRKAYFNGCEFDEFRNDFATMATLAHLGSAPASEQRNATFLLSDAFSVTGLNVEAENYVRSEFARGVWYVVI